MNFFDKTASATRMIHEGFRDLDEEERLEGVAKTAEQQRRRHIVNGYYPDHPTKRMSLSLHRDQLEVIEVTQDEWRIFQERNDLASGFDPVTGERLTREQYAEAIRQLALTSEDLREINYWASVENDMTKDCIVDDAERAWSARPSH